MWSGQVQPPRFNCPARVLEFQSIGIESPTSLPWGREARLPPAPLGLPENALQGWGWGPPQPPGWMQDLHLVPSCTPPQRRPCQAQSQVLPRVFRKHSAVCLCSLTQRAGGCLLPTLPETAQRCRAWLWAPLCVNSSQQREVQLSQAAGKALLISHATDAFGGQATAFGLSFHSCYVR